MCTATATVPREVVAELAAPVTPAGTASATPVWTGDQVHLQLLAGRLQVTPLARPPFVAERAVRPFPYSSPKDIVVLVDEEGTERGWLVELDRLDSASRQALDACTLQEYLIPRIQRIISAKEEFDILTWQVQTDHGPRTLEIRGRRNIRWIGPGRVLVKDADGNRFEIPQVDQLDAQSRDIVDAEL